MNGSVTRRQILQGAAGALALAAPILSAHAETAPLQLRAATRTIEVNGRAASVFSLTGPDGNPGLILPPGARFRVALANETGVASIVHWHGQLPPWTEDGFPWPQTPPIPPGQSHAYDFTPIPGTFWMHSHQGLQEQNLLAAPLIVRSAADPQAQDIVLMLHDFSFRSAEALQAGLRHPPEHGMAMPMASNTKPAMDLNDIAYDAFLANERTLADPQIVQVAPRGPLRLRVINGASASQFWIDLGALAGQVVAVDGHPVFPVAGRRFPLAIAQRLDILLSLPAAGAYPIFAQVEGRRARTGIILASSGAPVRRLPSQAAMMAGPVDLSLELRLRAAAPLPARPVTRTHRLLLDGSMAPYAWSINGQYWPEVNPLIVAPGERVAIEMVNRSMMAHPMHLHGHAFQVVALNGVALAGAVRDTVLVPPKGRLRIVFDADNPGRWALHCHNLYHMMAGMMTEVRYPGVI